MNTFINALNNIENETKTENGAAALKSLNDMVYDMFAFGGAYRQRREDDCITLFKKAFEENQLMALKCLFYLGDVRGGKLFA